MVDPVAFTLFGVDVYWYGIMVGAAVIIGIAVTFVNAKRQSIPSSVALDACLVSIPAGLIGARLYYVAFEWQSAGGSILSIFDLKSGGLAIFGAILAGGLAIYLYSRAKKLKFLDLTDLMVPALALGQAIGRFGNYFNQESFGFAVKNTALRFFPIAIRIKSETAATWHLAAFFYEALLDLAIFLTLWFAFRQRKAKRGIPTYIYLALYGAGRALIELVRTDALSIVRIPDGKAFLELVDEGVATAGQFPISSYVGILLFAIAIVMMIVTEKKYAGAETSIPETEPSDIVDIPSAEPEIETVFAAKEKRESVPRAEVRIESSEAVDPNESYSEQSPHFIPSYMPEEPDSTAAAYAAGNSADDSEFDMTEGGAVASEPVASPIEAAIETPADPAIEASIKTPIGTPIEVPADIPTEKPSEAAPAGRSRKRPVIRYAEIPSFSDIPDTEFDVQKLVHSESAAAPAKQPPAKETSKEESLPEEPARPASEAPKEPEPADAAPEPEEKPSHRFRLPDEFFRD